MEVDFLVLIAGVRVAAIEVDGGQVCYQDGQWLTMTKGGIRRISPIEQARKAKHALRRFLDRSPEWHTTHSALIRAEWFVVMPYTEVTGDMGSERRREQLLGKSDLGELVPKIREALSSTLINDPAPTDEDLDLVLTLLPRTERATITILNALMHSRMKNRRWALTAAASSVIAALAIGGFISQNLPSSSSAECNSNYEPCIPIAAYLSYSDIRMVVEVMREDPYDLDRDGCGCEIYK